MLVGAMTKKNGGPNPPAIVGARLLHDLFLFLSFIPIIYRIRTPRRRLSLPRDRIMEWATYMQNPSHGEGERVLGLRKGCKDDVAGFVYFLSALSFVFVLELRITVFQTVLRRFIYRVVGDSEGVQTRTGI